MRLVALLISFCWISTVFADSAEDKFDITFGVIDESNGYQDVKKEVKIIELRTQAENYNYGFKVIPGTSKSYSYYTVSYLPEMPRVLRGKTNSKESYKYNLGFKSPESQQQGAVIVSFHFDEGDPVGLYRTELYVNGEKIRTVEYEVIPKR